MTILKFRWRVMFIYIQIIYIQIWWELIKKNPNTSNQFKTLINAQLVRNYSDKTFLLIHSTLITRDLIIFSAI